MAVNISLHAEMDLDGRYCLNISKTKDNVNQVLIADHVLNVEGIESDDLLAPFLQIIPSHQQTTESEE